MSQLKIIGISLFVIIVLASYVILQENRIDRLSKEKHDVINFSKSDSIKIDYYKNKFNQEVAKTITLELSLRDAKALSETDRLQFIKQFDNIRKDLKNLEQATSITAKIVGNWKIPLGDTTIINLDSTLTVARKFDNKNEWVRLRGFITKDSIDIKPEVIVPLQSVLYWQRNKFLGLRIGKKQWFTDVVSPNPYVKITKQEVIRIEKK